MNIKPWAAALAISSLVACSSGTKTSDQPLATAEPTGESDMGALPTAIPTSSSTTDAASIPTTPPVAAPEPAADIVVVPMKMVFDAKKGMTAEVKADKTIWIKGKKIGAFDKNALVVDDPGAGSIAIMKDGSINVTPAETMAKKVKLNDKDELLVDNGAKLSIDDKGKVTLLSPEGKVDPKAPAAPAITGFKPEARRAGVLLTILWMSAQTKEPTSTGTTSTSAPASSSTATAKAAPAPSAAPTAAPTAAPKK